MCGFLFRFNNWKVPHIIWTLHIDDFTINILLLIFWIFQIILENIENIFVIIILLIIILLYWNFYYIGKFCRDNDEIFALFLTEYVYMYLDFGYVWYSECVSVSVSRCFSMHWDKCNWKKILIRRAFLTEFYTDEIYL